MYSGERCLECVLLRGSSNSSSSSSNLLKLFLFSSIVLIEL